jgi:sugar phosphate isomerase/epimerase
MREEISASTWAFVDRPIEGSIKVMKGLGINSIEIWGDTPSHFDPLDRERISSLMASLREAGVEADSLHAPFGPDLDITHLDPEMRRRAVDAVKSSVDAARRLDAGSVIIHPGHLMQPRQEAKRYELAAISLEEIHDSAKDLGIGLYLENLYSDDDHLVFCDTPPKVLHLVRSMEELDIKICLDTSHANIMGDVSEAIEICGNAIGRTHISDNMGEDDDHLPPGQGTIDWHAVFDSLRRIHYEGPLTLEVAGRGSPETQLRDATEFVSGTLEGGEGQ